MKATPILDTHYTACVSIKAKTYSQMSINEKINCKSYFKSCFTKSFFQCLRSTENTAPTMSWMITDRLYQHNFQKPYRE